MKISLVHDSKMILENMRMFHVPHSELNPFTAAIFSRPPGSLKCPIRISSHPPDITSSSGGVTGSRKWLIYLILLAERWQVKVNGFVGSRIVRSRAGVYILGNFNQERFKSKQDRQHLLLSLSRSWVSHHQAVL